MHEKFTRYVNYKQKPARQKSGLRSVVEKYGKREERRDNAMTGVLTVNTVLRLRDNIETKLR